MCGNALTYLMRETNPDRAGCPPSVLSPLNCSDLWKFSYQPSSWWEFLLLHLLIQWPPLCYFQVREGSPLQTWHPLQPFVEKPQLLPAALSPQDQTHKAEGSSCQEKYTVTWGKIERLPKKLCFVFLCFLLVCVIDALCGGKSGINFFQLNLVFSHHKNRSSSNLGVVPSIYFLP